jgi:hypothetical protein
VRPSGRRREIGRVQPGRNLLASQCRLNRTPLLGQEPAMLDDSRASDTTHTP